MASASGQEKIASIAEAAAEAADMQTSSLESDAGQNDEQEQVRPAATEHKDPGTAAAQIAAEEEEAEREKARIAAAEEEAEREKARLAAEKAEQERAQAEIARGMEVVREAALQRSILLSRIPRCQGQVQCQVNGKKTFANVFLELADGVLRMNDGDAVLRKCVRRPQRALHRSHAGLPVLLHLTGANCLVVGHFCCTVRLSRGAALASSSSHAKATNTPFASTYKMPTVLVARSTCCLWTQMRRSSSG